MALKLASKPELTFYFLVVVCLQLLVLRDGMQLSEDAAAALATPSSHFRLPARLTSMLQIPPAFVQARKTQAEDGASVWWYMIQRPVAWFLNRPRDVSDIQWRDFRGGLGPLAAAMAAFVVLSRLARLRSTRLRMLNNVMASILFIGITHGPTGTLWVFLLASVSYLLIKAVAGTHYGPAVIWGWHCASFLFIRWNNGLRFSSLSPRLSFLDGHSSMLRWHIHYNFLLLRLLSFAMDLHWARKQQQQQQQLCCRAGRVWSVCRVCWRSSTLRSRFLPTPAPLHGHWLLKGPPACPWMTSCPHLSPQLSIPLTVTIVWRAPLREGLKGAPQTATPSPSPVASSSFWQMPARTAGTATIVLA
mmetsp:Transcript_9915/g.25546  ORF Transcript_9915/g.25546 Transcript_9915/m.25546 type:complete len:360 (-) Transcript_9915:2615-3694(-)